jgi:hypothetical protein
LKKQWIRVSAFLRCIVVVLAVFGISGSIAHAQTKKTSTPAAKPAAPAHPATAAHPPAGAASHSATAAGASHGPTANGVHGPTANGAHGPTTNGAAHNPMAGGGARPGGVNGAGAHNASFGGGRTPAGSHEMRTANGSMVRTRANGSRADVHDARRGMDIHHGLNGNRHVMMERGDHSRVFAARGGRGFVQHPYMFHGREFGHRTYFYHGRAYDRFYGRYPYRGVYLDVYAPRVYYAPGFYGWVYNPWPAPIVYPWGFAAAPWYGVYGAYFTPYPVYPTASLWLTDYLVSTSLAAAYQASADEQAAPAMQAGAAPLTPETKQAIADEVQRQVALENQESQQNAQGQEADFGSSGIARMLSDNQAHTFVIGADLDLVTDSNQECSVSQGDVIQVSQAPPADATAAQAVVLASKGGNECARSSNVSVQFTDLQEMQNHMRETIDQGMGELQSKQGQSGLPAAPASAKAAPVPASFAAAAPPPDSNAGTEISQQMQQADQSEQEVASAATGAPAPPADVTAPAAPAAPAAAPATIALGQTVDQVTASLGVPKRIIDLGTKKIYVYQDMKITFKAGKVSDVE